MAITDRPLEVMLVAMYPRSLKHLQQLVMDCERCANSRGKRTLFGADKLEKANRKLLETVKAVHLTLAVDTSPEILSDFVKGLDEINTAVQLLKSTYLNWPAAYEYWNFWYSEARKILDQP